MSCAEIDQAIQWLKQVDDTYYHLVRAYFTRHGGGVNDPQSDGTLGADVCTYAVGNVTLAGGLLPHLEGQLAMYGNGGNLDAAMEKKANSAISVQIHPSGTISYQQLLHGKPVGGMPPIQVSAACLQDVLLMGTRQSEVVAIGVQRYAVLREPK